MKQIIIGIVLAFTMWGCSDWLDVKPTSEREAKDFLNTVNGYKGALTGLYMKMKDDKVYGNNLTMGMVEYMAQHWTPVVNTEGKYMQDLNYRNSSVETRINDMFLQMYNIIVGANKILEEIDDHREIFADTALYQLIKGEALAIRAWVHFDALRLWGPIPAEKTDEMVLPYVTTCDRNAHAYLSFDQYTKLLLQDMSMAERLLKYIEPLQVHSLTATYTSSEGFTPDDNFWRYRSVRMNYYAVLGLKARTYLWIGDRTNALIYARQVMDAISTGHGKKTYRLSTEADMKENKQIMSTEHIMALDVYNLDSKVSSRFKNSGNGNYSEDQQTIRNLYGGMDYRYDNWWKEVDVSLSKNVFTLSKYFQSGGMSKETANKIPLLRLSEMYMIAIECEDPEAETLYHDFCTCRGIEAESLSDRQTVLLNQYNKEFWGEGVLFFTYKRLGVKDMWRGKRIEDLKMAYVLPLPDREVKH